MITVPLLSSVTVALPLWASPVLQMTQFIASSSF
jgi:hypothetical protein